MQFAQSMEIEPLGSKIMAGWKKANQSSAIGILALIGATAALGQVPYLENFEAGNLGFYSDHTYHAPPSLTNGPSGPLWQTQTYALDTNPNNWHSLWASFADHTTGTGKMMIINAASDTGNCSVKVWRSPVISVTPGKDYEISYWVAISIAFAQPLLKTFVNGIEMNTFDAGSPPVLAEGVWHQVKFAWASGAAATATIELCDDRTLTFGDDYALDDISLKDATAQWCSPGYWRQPQHLDSWPASISPNDLYSSWIQPNPPVSSKANGCKNAPANPTLITVLTHPQCYGGDAFNKVGDLLSDAHPDVNFLGTRVENSCPLN
jgi:hypothetical protein